MATNSGRGYPIDAAEGEGPNPADVTPPNPSSDVKEAIDNAAESEASIHSKGQDTRKDAGPETVQTEEELRERSKITGGLKA